LVGNSIGKKFVVTCFGESHGKCVGVVIDGCPAGLPLSESDVQMELDKRKPGGSRVSTPRIEEDKAVLLSGVFNNFTTGAPICIIVWNKDVKSEGYNQIKRKPRPGHADYTASIRYGGFNDHRGGGRFSGRITLAYVIAGTVAKKLLKLIDVEILAHTVQIGNIKLSTKVSNKEIRKNVYKNSVRCADSQAAITMEREILKVKKAGDSIGGLVEGLVLNYPAGLGDPIFDSLDSDIAKMIFNIPAVKAIEFGAGLRVVQMQGSENNDQFRIKDGKIITETNNCGGILGGLSNGMPIVIRVAFKPTPSISKKQKTINLKEKKETKIELSGRHDPCIVPRAVPVVEASLAIVLIDHVLRTGAIPLNLNRK
jgi:chorismate synthase